MDKIVESLAYIAGMLFVPLILFLLWGHWYLMFGLLAILFIISLLVPTSTTSNSSKSNSIEGTYDVFTRDAQGDLTYKRHWISKDS